MRRSYLFVWAFLGLLFAGSAAVAQSPWYDSTTIHRLPPVGGDWLVRGQASVSLSGFDEADAVSLASYDGAGLCGDKDGCKSDCKCVGNWYDNTYAFFAGDGWKNIVDDDDNNNFGFRTGFNTGFNLPKEPRMRAQFGASFGAYDFHGREDGRESAIEQQVFITAGLYKRSDVCNGDRLSWGVVYDAMIADELGEMTDYAKLSQLRAQFGWARSESDEFGIWFAVRLKGDYLVTQDDPVDVVDQANFFWKRNWSYGGDTMLYAGWADDPGETVLGFRGTVPLSARMAMFGNVHYVVPSTRGGDVHPRLPGFDDIFNQETWNVSFGFVFYPGAKSGSHTVSGRRGLPLLPVADNGLFNLQAPLF